MTNIKIFLKVIVFVNFTCFLIVDVNWLFVSYGKLMLNKLIMIIIIIIILNTYIYNENYFDS